MSVQTQIKTDIHKRLDAMHTARATWEEGTLRASNDELYAILESVYALYAELKTEVGKRRAFAALLTDLEVKTQANTSLALKVIRYVFANQGRREEAYARVVAIAHDMKSPDQSFTSYVQECGGIEEVRRVSTSTKSTAMSKEDFKKLALEGLQEVQVGVSTFDLPTFIQPNTDYEEDYAVAWYAAMTTARVLLFMVAMKQASSTLFLYPPAKTLMSALKKASPSLMQAILPVSAHAT